MTDDEILQVVLSVWGVCYGYAFVTGMFAFYKQQRKPAFFTRFVICLGFALLGPIFVVLDLVYFVRRNFRNVVAGLIVVVSFIFNMVVEVLVKAFILLFNLVFIFFPARKR